MSEKQKVPGLKVTVSFFREGKQFIAYCPSLDLSAYGDTFDEAQKSFEETFDIFFEELHRKGTLEDVLTECGWVKVKKPRSEWAPPSFITNIEKDVAIPA